MPDVIDKLAWVHLAGKKLLCVRTKGKEVFYNPGGKREANESDIEALMREVKEELSIDLIPETIKHFHTFELAAHGKSPGVTVRMTCYTGDFEGEIRPSGEIEEAAWLSYADRNTAKVTDAGRIIFDYLQERDLLA